LNCEPETDSNPAGSTHTVTCTLRDAANATVNAQPAAVVVNGEVDCLTNCGTAVYGGGMTAADANDTPTDADQVPNADDDDRSDPDGSCIIQQGTSSCQISYNRNDVGNDELNFWIDGHNATDDEAQNEAENNDETDTVLKNWVARTYNALDCVDQSGDDVETNQQGEAETYTCTTYDQFGQPIATTIDIDGENETGVNDPDNPDSNSPGTPDYPACSTANTTSCQFQVPGTDVGGGPNGTNVDETGTAQICFFEVGQSADCGADGAGNDPNDFDPGNDNNVATDDTGNANQADRVTKTWQAAIGSRLNCTPEVSANPTTSQHDITCTVRDQNNNTVSGVNIDVEASGANDPDGANSN
jgi:hypothetical protein